MAYIGKQPHIAARVEWRLLIRRLGYYGDIQLYTGNPFVYSVFCGRSGFASSVGSFARVFACENIASLGAFARWGNPVLDSGGLKKVTSTVIRHP